MIKTLITLTALAGLTTATFAQERLGDVLGGLRQSAIQVGDEYAGMFGPLGPDNPIVVQAIKSCAVTYGYKDAASVSQFLHIAQEEMRKEAAELEKAN